jgi:outer membrane protein assembly factor BamA
MISGIKKSYGSLFARKTHLKFYLILFLVSFYYLPNTAFPQLSRIFKNDSTKYHKKNYTYLDTLKLLVSDVKISGNNVTSDDIILREMQLTKGKIFNSEQCNEDRDRINNLGIFERTEIEPLLKSENRVQLKVNVKEKWYIYPMPSAGIVDGDLRKIWVGASVRWQNFRGRNENVMLNFGVGYNPFIHASYTIPWIGENLHLFSTLSGGYSKDRNRSQLALGHANGSRTYNYRSFNDSNFDYYDYSLKWMLGKYFTRNFSVYTEVGYVFTQVTSYNSGRTISPDGIDRYLLTGIGINYDSRNNREFTTKGLQMHLDYQHFGLINDIVDFGRMNFSQSGYMPAKINDDYSAILTERLNTSIAFGPNIPYYNHKFIGYGGDIIRGWYWFGFEGDNSFVLNNEIKFPIISPNFLEGSQIPLIKKIKYLKNYSYKYGLYFTTFYDLGTVWNNGDGFQNMKFLNGTGIGLNALLPFGMNAKVEWGVRLGSTSVGQLIFSFGGRL